MLQLTLNNLSLCVHCDSTNMYKSQLETIKLEFTMTIAARKAYNDGYNFNGPSLQRECICLVLVTPVLNFRGILQLDCSGTGGIPRPPRTQLKNNMQLRKPYTLPDQFFVSFRFGLGRFECNFVVSIESSFYILLVM